ncbi:kinase-like domain-containing protein [Mycena galopus ATCC 62051]|nr:kinase-like domain-containing protein [Mycena galopus ATCC 62051]
MHRDLYIVVAKLILFLRDPESYKKFLSCRGTDAQQLLDLLQDLLDLDSFSFVKPLMLQALLQLARPSGLHPRCFVLPGLRKVGQQVAGGGFGDIWKGVICGQSVCVKIMRIFEESDIQAALKEFGREAVIWRQMCHPNVLPFFGVYYLGSRLCLVSPWMEEGHIVKFIANKKPTNAERLSLILDVAFGLEYLHGQKIVHGDLKGINILVTPSRRACIADFGVSSIANAMTVRFTHSTAKAQGGTARYQAPENLRGDRENHTGSDVYAFACVLEGNRPSRPLSCSGTMAYDGLWNLMQMCWEEDALMRSTASKIVDRLKGPLIGAKPKSSASDWDNKFTSKFRRSMQAQPLLPSVTQIERTLFGDESCRR